MSKLGDWDCEHGCVLGRMSGMRVVFRGAVR